MSSGFAAERQAIEGRWANNWSTTPTVYDNVPAPDTTSAWCRLTILNADAKQADTAGLVHRYRGIIQVDVFVPQGTGTEHARTLADAAAAIFSRKTFSAPGSGNIVTQVPNITRRQPENGWAGYAVSVGYRRDLAQ